MMRGIENERFQDVAYGLNALLHMRLAEAKPVQVLSDRGDKLLQVVEEPDGRRSVTRSFTPHSLFRIEKYGMDFENAWVALHEMFGDAEIDVLPSAWTHGDEEYPYIVVSRYLENGQPFINAPTEQKIQVARGMGKLLSESAIYLPSLEMLNKEMFMFDEADEGPKVYMTDLDPLVSSGFWRLGEDGEAMIIERLGDLFWDNWCRPEEREEVLGALALSLSDALEEDFDIFSPVGKAFLNIHTMMNGVDPRESGLAI